MDSRGRQGDAQPDHGGRRRSPVAAFTAGAVAATAALAVAVLLVFGVRALTLAKTQEVWVQFSDLAGRVQLEYCPDLPSSFTGTVRTDDLRGTSGFVPVHAGPELCGDSRFPDGVWLHLDRSSVTLATRQPG